MGKSPPHANTPHKTNLTSMAAARRAITYLHRLMASTCEADLAGSCSRALPKQIQQGHFSPSWRAHLRTTLEPLPPGPSPLELAHGLKQSSIRTILPANNVEAAPPQHLPPPRADGARQSIKVVIRPTYTGCPKARRLARHRRLESATAPSPPPTEGDAIGEYASIACILSRETPLPAPTRRSQNWDEFFLVEWRPEKYPYHVVLAQRDRGLTTVSMIVLDEFTELAPIEEAELDPPASRAPRAGATRWTQTYSNANDAFNGYTAIAYPPTFRPAKSYKSLGGHAPTTPPPPTTTHVPINYA